VILEVKSQADRKGRISLRTTEVGGVINRPVEDVFAVLSDPENAPKWSLNAIEEKLTSPPPVRVGTTRRALVRSLGGGTTENHAVCTAFELNRRLAWKSTSGLVPFSVTVDMTPVDGATRLDSTWAFEFHGPLRLVAPLLQLMFKRAMQRDVENLKLLMEAGML
jgi:uncharacterized protein YndB with AHSA1/START domain